MENMQFTREKVILSMSKIKHIQELIKFRKERLIQKRKVFKNERDVENHINYIKKEILRYINMPCQA